MNYKFRDLRADEIDVRIGEAKESYFTLLLYKDARVDMDILDETVGAMNWQRRHNRDNANCEIGIYDENKKEWVWKEDTGTESNTEAEKGIASDSFKRAGVNWGIGRELYTSPKIYIKAPMTEYKTGKWKPQNLSNFYVSQITIENKKIIRLILKAYNRDTKRDEVVYSYETQVSPDEQKPEKPSVEPQTDNKPTNNPFPREMSLIEANSVKITTKSGEEKFVMELSDKLLEQLLTTTEPKWAEARAAAKVILEARK